MQIWKSTNILIFIWKWYEEDLTLKHYLLFEIHTRVRCVKSLFTNIQNFFKYQILSIKNIYKLHGQITWEFLGLRMWNSQDSVFISTQTYTEIFKSALVYLYPFFRYRCLEYFVIFFWHSTLQFFSVPLTITLNMAFSLIEAGYI